ncbi:MAG TPA: RDD family protein [Gammaproteobacteria bacterium]
MTATEEHSRQGAPGAPRPAGLARRLAAFVYDALLIAALLFAFTLALVLARGGRAIPPGTWWFGASLLALKALFFCWFWSRGGQTLGMRAWRLRLERRGGGPVTFARAAARYAAAWVSALAAGCGFWWSLLDRERRCWHDAVCGTRVVLLPKITKRSSRDAPSGRPAA